MGHEDAATLQVIMGSSHELGAAVPAPVRPVSDLRGVSVDLVGIDFEVVGEDFDGRSYPSHAAGFNFPARTTVRI